MKFYSKKIVELKNADCHLHYANNKGRGTNNVTLTIVEKGQQREGNTSAYCDNYMARRRVSGWAGNVNIPNELIETYGGLV